MKTSSLLRATTHYVKYCFSSIAVKYLAVVQSLDWNTYQVVQIFKMLQSRPAHLLPCLLQSLRRQLSSGPDLQHFLNQQVRAPRSSLNTQQPCLSSNLASLALLQIALAYTVLNLGGVVV